MRTLALQGARFTAAGVAQLLLDWGVFSAFRLLSGATIAPNIAGRMAGAALGFWLHGRFTFAEGGEVKLGTRRFLRYVALWLLMTTLSTLCMKGVELALGGHAVYWFKPAIEATLALMSFFIARHWVYD